MNLIEQLGGYEKCKDILSQPNIDFIMNAQGLREHMLEYRRQHNIYEVGDIAVNSKGDESRLLKIWRVDMCAHNSKMSIADYDADGLAGWSRFHCLRHATNEEIKAGKRRPELDSDTCSDIRNHIPPLTKVIDR